MTDARISFLGDSCLSVAFEERMDPAINQRCIALAESLKQQRGFGIRDIVPGFHTVTVYFDPLEVDYRELADHLQRSAVMDVLPATEDGPAVEIAVRYGAAEGPDLPAVAAFASCSEAEVIRLHTGRLYRVFMLGFLPGFAYLGSVDPKIAMPRHEKPRIKVAAGSVGIAGLQTAVYPCDTPGGWQIIGHTDTSMFDSSRQEPSLLRPGQRVRFVAA